MIKTIIHTLNEVKSMKTRDESSGMIEATIHTLNDLEVMKTEDESFNMLKGYIYALYNDKNQLLKDRIHMLETALWWKYYSCLSYAVGHVYYILRAYENDEISIKLLITVLSS